MTYPNSTLNTLHLHVHLVSMTVLDQISKHKTQKKKFKKIKHSLRTNSNAVINSILTIYKYGNATLKSFENEQG